MKSYKTEVYVDKEWSTNSLRFATEAEAVAYSKELLSRWYVPTDSRATPCDDEVKDRFNFDIYRAEPITS